MGLVLPNWNPLRLAEDIAVADHLTGGRELMQRSWSSDLWSYQSDLMQIPPPGLPWPHPVSARLGAGVTDGKITEIATVPKPLQTPHPPLFTTLTQSPHTLDWAARVGSSIVTIASDPDMVAGLFQGYAAEATAHGRPIGPGEWRPDGGVALCRILAVAATHEAAMERARESVDFVAEWLGEFGFFEAWRLPGQEGPVPKTLEQVMAAGAIVAGTPDEAGEQILRLRETTGAEYVVFVPLGGAAEHAHMMEMIELFGSQVISAFADTEPATAVMP